MKTTIQHPPLAGWSEDIVLCDICGKEKAGWECIVCHKDLCAKHCYPHYTGDDDCSFAHTCAEHREMFSIMLRLAEEEYCYDTDSIPSVRERIDLKLTKMLEEKK